MILAGLQKMSLIDYPGKVSCVAFVTGCNMACPFCHNRELALGRFPQRIMLDEFLQFITLRKGLLEGVVVSGGEPTLAPDLGRLCRTVREIGLAVKLDTNGSCPEILAQLTAQGLIDYIAMDIKTDPDRYAPELTNTQTARRVLQSIRLIMQSGVDYEFRTTCVHPFVDDTIVVKIARAIQGARRYILQPFRPAAVLRPDFFTSDDPGYASQAMKDFRQAASPWVTECLVRG